MTDIVAQINDKNERAEYDAALKIAIDALKHDPDDYALQVAAGNAYYGLRDFQKAEQCYLTAAAACPQDAVCWSNLAGVRYETGRYPDALAACDKALTARPDYPNALIHRGNALSALNRFDESVAAYEQALQQTPDDLLALFNLAYALSMTDRNEQAADIYKDLLRRSPRDPEYLFAAAALAEKTEDYARAAELYLRLLAEQETPTTHIMLSGCLYNLQLRGDTQTVWRLTDEWLAAFPDNAVAAHTLETLKNGHDVKRASAEYVKELFDAFADSFDSVLAGLSYRAPELVATAVQRLDFSSAPDVLDLGCGTGLCAAALAKKGVALQTLTGVDLSAGMLEKAGAGKRYTRLEQNDILSFLPENKNRFDLIISSDVFTYLGDLSELFAGMASALKNGGQTVFTVSENTENETEYAMEPSGRFAHGAAYIRTQMEQNGLSVANIEKTELRLEMGQPVRGLLVTGKKK